MKWVLLLTVILPIVSKGYVGSVSAATGNSGNASIEASETPFSNPAGLAFLEGYYFTAGFGQSKSSGVDSAQDLAVSLTDNMRDTIIPTSLAYNQTSIKTDSSDDIFRRQFRLGFGNFVRKGAALGLSIVHQNDRLPDDSYSQTNLNIGTLWALNESLGFAIRTDSVLGVNKDIPLESRMNQVTAIGMSYNYQKFVRAKMDIETDSGHSAAAPRILAGLESYMNRWLILRIGGERNNEEQYNLYTAGLGFVGPKFGFHYAFQNSPDDVELTRHSVDLAIPIW